MILSIEGEEATGKTTLAYSSPLPIVGFALDMGFERALFGGKYEELFKGLDIVVVEWKDGILVDPPETRPDILIYRIPIPIQIDQNLVKGARELWNIFLVKVVAALQDQEVKTVVIDTMTLARKLKAAAYLQSLQENDLAAGKPPRRQLIQIEYGATNDAVRDIFTTGAAVEKNLVAVHHLTDEYGDHMTPKGEIERVTTGRRVLEGLTGTHKFVDVALRTTKVKNGAAVGIDAEFLKCGYELTVEGGHIENPTWDRVVTRVSMAVGERITFDMRKP